MSKDIRAASLNSFSFLFWRPGIAFAVMPSALQVSSLSSARIIIPSNPPGLSFCSAGRPRRSQTADALATQTPLSGWDSVGAEVVVSMARHRAGMALGRWVCIRGAADMNIGGRFWYLVLGRLLQTWYKFDNAFELPINTPAPLLPGIGG